MAITIFMLIAVLIVGVRVNGAKSWFAFGGFSAQPAEFAKLTTIIYLAAWLASKGHSIRSFENGLIPFVVIISGVCTLILMEPDFGTTMVLVAITVTMFWAGGASWIQMLTLGASGTIVIAFLAATEGHRIDRINAFLNAEADPAGTGYQTIQSLIALGNGGIDGLGLGASRGKFFYIPGSHTDGIFAVIGEELGIIATLSILALFMLLMIRGYQIASRCLDPFGYLVAVGVTTWITTQALINIGGITRVIPLTGIPLPLISFGGSALAAVLLALGIVANISRYADRPEAAPLPETEAELDAERPRSIIRRRRTDP
jgi:cell division protein FtsW